MKNFIILGSDGFLGSHLLKRLIKINKKIYPISRNKSKNLNYDIFTNYKWFRHITNKSIILFFAFENNLYLFEKNYFKLSNTYNLFLLNFYDYLKKKKLRPKIIFTSTVSVYPSSNKKKINEMRFPEPISWYDFNKYNFENHFLFFSKIHDLKFLSLRLSNIIGVSNHSQKKRGFLNKILTSKKKMKIELLNSGEMYRDYLYIDDAVEAILKITKNIDKIKTGIYNLCSGKSTKLIDALKIIKKKIKIELDLSKKKKNNFHKIEFRNFFGSNQLIKSQIDWSPEQNFEKIVDKILKN